MKICSVDPIYAFSKDNPPAARVAAPCRLTFETLDCMDGQVTSEEPRLEPLDLSRMNPTTGPVFIEGAEPGDALAVHIAAIRTADWGLLMTEPGVGCLPDRGTGKVVLCPIADDHYHFLGKRLPLRPMVGVIGTAPAGDPVSCFVPGVHGGNMDTADIAAGSLLYLPVFVPGALLAMGDLHAVMGDGEVGLTGLEVAGEVEVTVTVVKGMSLPYPLLKTADEVAFITSAETLDEALRLSVECMHTLLLRETGLDADEALMLMGLVGQSRISQVVDPLKTARFCMPRDVLREFGAPVGF